MYVPDTELIMVRFEALLASVTGIVPFGAVKTVTRVWQSWEQVAQIAQPAIVIVEPREKETARRGQQPSLSLQTLLVCYIQCDPKDTVNPPNTRVNSFLKAIRTALLPQGSDIALNAQTLGGLVSNAFIDGEIVKDAGILDDQGSLMVPVSLQLT